MYKYHLGKSKNCLNVPPVSAYKYKETRFKKKKD